MEDIAVCVEYPCRTLNFLKVGLSFPIKKNNYTNPSIKMTNWLKLRVNHFWKISFFCRSLHENERS